MDSIEQEYVEIIAQLQNCAERLRALGVQSFKSGQPAAVVRYAGDPRGLSIAVTHIETAMLWTANARPQGEENADGR